MKLLFVTNGYPTKRHPEFCAFTKEQIESIRHKGKFESELFFINARDKGVLEYFRVIKPLKKKIKNCDIVHAFHGLSFLLVFFLSPRKDIVVSFLNSIENEYSEKKYFAKFLSYITNKIIKRPNIKKIFKDKIPPEHLNNSYYLPNGVDVSKFYPIQKNEAKKKLNLDFDKRYILFISSKNKFRKQKRYDRFKKVMGILRIKLPNIEELSLVNEPQSKLVYYFNAAELHLLTSDFEGSPNSVKEAMACNVQVVSTNVGNVSELLEGVNGSFVSKSTDPEELAELAYRALTFTGEINSRDKLIEKKLDIDSVAENIILIYKNILNE